MKLTGKPIYPAELAPTTKVAAAETAIADNKTAADTAIAAVKTTADKATTDLAALTTTVAGNKTTADTAISNETTARTNADKAITDAATALTTRVSELYYESASPPNFDLPNWRFWHQTAIQGTDRRSQLYYRIIEANDAILLHDVTYPTA